MIKEIFKELFMSFSGKATYSAGVTLPELVDDISDLVSIVAPGDSPLLYALGDPLAVATSTRHEWVEDELLPNTDLINQPALVRVGGEGKAAKLVGHEFVGGGGFALQTI